MKSKILKTLTFLVVCSGFLGILSGSIPATRAETEEEKLTKLKEQIQEYQNEIEKLQNQANTLANQVAQFDAQINLTLLKINQTEEKILQLGGRIERIKTSVDSLQQAFSRRAVRTYMMARVGEPYLIVFSAPDISTMVTSLHYLKKIQEADTDLIAKLKDAKDTYEEEKDEQLSLQEELEEQRQVLGAQKSAKANLLATTKNDEKKYQELLASARAEFEAIQAIIAGQGDEEEVGQVEQGEQIASIIQGASCNSSGSHLHFIVRDSNDHAVNPFNFLAPGIAYENCSGSSCGSDDGDAFNPSGSWNWPISPAIKYSQGFGTTWATRNTWVGRIYSAHNGIDINSNTSPVVTSVQSGTLFRGSYTGYRGCRLRYVRVDHDNSEYDTLYLHINY